MRSAHRRGLLSPILCMKTCTKGWYTSLRTSEQCTSTVFFHLGEFIPFVHVFIHKSAERRHACMCTANRFYSFFIILYRVSCFLISVFYFLFVLFRFMSVLHFCYIFSRVCDFFPFGPFFIILRVSCLLISGFYSVFMRTVWVHFSLSF